MTIQKKRYSFGLDFLTYFYSNIHFETVCQIFGRTTPRLAEVKAATQRRKNIYKHNNTIDSPFILIKGTCWSERTETSVSDVTIVDRKNKTKKQTRTKVILMLHLTHLFLLSNIFSFSCSTNYELCFRPVESEVIKLFLIQLETDCYAVGVRAAAIDHILKIHQKK